ncbi:MFS general substrate transporter [Peniophora sp. CONT]|nr:MFS general substrate transporter [Peniophora sp. CONT]
MTMAPRVEVYTKIACRAVHQAQDPRSSPAPHFYEYLMPRADVYDVNFGHNDAPAPLTLNFSDPNPLSVDECSGDPRVQGRAARIQASVKTTESILSAITTGWLSHLSDVYGRKKILALTVSGALFMDIVYILVSTPNTVFGRHGEAFIILAPLVEGFLGAQSLFGGITHAYAADCTSGGSRSQIFVMMQGMLYVGLSIGPWIDGAILNFNHRSTNETLFAASIAVALTNLILIIFILPESLLPERRLGSNFSFTRHRESSVSSEDVARDKSSWHVMVYRLKKFIRNLLIRPISIFFPKKLEGRKGYDWNLTLVGVVQFIYILSIQVYNLKYLYTKHVYGWTGEQLGYYMSLLYVTRAINLLLLLPTVLAYFAPKRPTNNNATLFSLSQAIVFDRAVTAISYFTDATANALVVLAPSSNQGLFIFLTSLNSITSGGYPALQSLGAVTLQNMGRGSEIGLVFGAMGLINSASHIIAPGIYAALYGATVAKFPKAIFALSAVLLYLAVGALMLIRSKINFLPSDGEYAPAPQDEDAVADEDSDALDDESPRGRRERRSLSRHEIEEARRASIARLSISES